MKNLLKNKKGNGLQLERTILFKMRKLKRQLIEDDFLAPKKIKKNIKYSFKSLEQNLTY